MREWVALPLMMIRGIFLMLIIFPIDEFWCILKAHCIRPMVNVVLSIRQWFSPIILRTLFWRGGLGAKSSFGA